MQLLEKKLLYQYIYIYIYIYIYTLKKNLIKVKKYAKYIKKIKKSKRVIKIKYLKTDMRSILLAKDNKLCDINS